MSEQKITLTIDGMHCGGCVRRVTAALGGVDGASDVTVEVGSATFVADDDDVVEAARAAVAGTGFTITGQTASAS
jgi:copper chaperone CopZ